MAEPESEKVVKDTLNQLLHDDELMYFQKVCTPRYQAEPIDFLAVNNDGVSHLIEVKESGTGNSISQSQFKDHQLDVLQDLCGVGEGKTHSWIIARMFSGDKNRNHSGYYESYFLCPGYYSESDMELSVRNCTESEFAEELGGYRAGSMYGLMSNDAGKTTKGNDTKGFRYLPKIAGK